MTVFEDMWCRQMLEENLRKDIDVCFVCLFVSCIVSFKTFLASQTKEMGFEKEAVKLNPSLGGNESLRLKKQNKINKKGRIFIFIFI